MRYVIRSPGEQEPDEAREVMDAKEAAGFLRLPYSSFREIAPTLPRQTVTPQRLCTCGASFWPGFWSGELPYQLVHRHKKGRDRA